MRKWILQGLLLSGPNATIITGGHRSVRTATSLALVMAKFVGQVNADHTFAFLKAREAWQAAQPDRKPFGSSSTHRPTHHGTTSKWSTCAGFWGAEIDL